MKKVIGFLGVLVVAGFILIPIPVPALALQGPEAWTIVNSTDISGMVINTTGTVYTKSISLKSGANFGVAYKVTGYTPNITIQVQESWVRPETEGSTDGNWTIPQYSGGSNLPNLETASTTNNTWEMKALSLVPAAYIRFVITGNTTNANSTIYMKLLKQEG